MGGKPRFVDGVNALYREMRALAQVGDEVGLADPPADLGAASRLRQLAPGIAVIPLRTPTLPPATTTNCYLVGDRELIVVDPATPDPSEKRVLDAVLAELATVGRRPVAVWLTHHHGDHVADAARLARIHGIPIAAHRETAARLPGIPIAEHLEDGDRRRLAGTPELVVRAVFTPGHAAGHLCFVDEGSGTCIAGDMVAGVGSILIDPAEGDMATYLASLRRLATLELSSLEPAHGPSLAEPRAALFAYVAHRLWRESRVLDALSARAATLATLVASVYSDVPKAIYPLAQRSLLAHLLKLRSDGLAESRDELWSSVATD